MTWLAQVAEKRNQSHHLLTAIGEAFLMGLRTELRASGFADGMLFALAGLVTLLGWGILSLTASVVLTFEEEQTPVWQQSERLVLPVVR